MAIATSELVTALRTTAARLEDGATYQWTHMGACNCGHLAQTLTRIDRAELHRLALQRAGDWGDQSIEHCATSGLPIDDVITTMLDAGMELRDIGELERLSAPDVLARIPLEERPLDRRDRAHVVKYMRAWAEMLEERLEPTSGVHEIARPVATNALRRAG
ncbi:hypothetical protein [Sandaracinus amylolyticus]|nr:hypothetical protein [Sandaracinus amylolyticus]